MVSGGPDAQGERGLHRYRPCGGGVEGSDGDSKSLAHILHNLLRFPPWIPVRSRHRYRQNRVQTAPAVSDHEGGGTAVIFLDLHKAYDALCRDRCVETLDGNNVGIRDFRILRK